MSDDKDPLLQKLFRKLEEMDAKIASLDGKIDAQNRQARRTFWFRLAIVIVGFLFGERSLGELSEKIVKFFSGMG